MRDYEWEGVKLVTCQSVFPKLWFILILAIYQQSILYFPHSLSSNTRIRLCYIFVFQWCLCHIRPSWSHIYAWCNLAESHGRLHDWTPTNHSSSSLTACVMYITWGNLFHLTAPLKCLRVENQVKFKPIYEWKWSWERCHSAATVGSVSFLPSQ